LHFAPDTEDVLEFTVALANTVAGATKTGQDELSTVDQLGAILAVSSYSGRIDHDLAELHQVRRTRAWMRELWLLERDDAVAEVNATLRGAKALPQLVRHDDFDWHIHATDPQAPLAVRMRVEISLAIVDVIRADENSRLRACAAPDCEGILADLSRNASKRFCSIRCGNRMNMIAFRERSAVEQN
jgi:hypothetical protein